MTSVRMKAFAGASAAALAVFLAAPSTSYAANGKCGEIVIGSALSFTGIYSTNGHNTQNGYEFGLKKLKDAGGVKIDGKCYNFVIKYYDDESTPARAAELTERLIEQDKVQYMLGPYGSGTTTAVAPVTEKYHIPLLEAEGASRSLFAKGYKYIFGALSTSEQYLSPVIELAAEMAKKEGKKPSDVKIAIAVQDDPFSRDVRAGVISDAKKFGMKIIIDDKLPRDLSDMSATLTKVKALHPDVLAVSGHEKGAATAAREIGQMRIDTPIIAMTHCESAKITTKFPKAAEGILCPTQWAETLPYKGPLFGSAENYNKEIKAAYPKVYTSELPYQTAQASAAIEIYRDAFERAGSLDKQKVRDALAATNLMTFYGQIKFAPDGHNIAKPMVLRQIQHGKYVPVAPTKYASGKIVWPRKPQ
ncbi:MAG TPA: amino acid ABC transporter substrate-binding protein [Pseudolabrys sp.]|nr:amino acid ABC transporter substrate-binding protein [Pseudolabrys sp.]